jgi:hypothetical protein
VTVEIAGAGHHPHETNSAQLLPPIQTFLSSTTPFEYSEASWDDRLTCLPRHGRGRHRAQRIGYDHWGSPD